jgi:hypothetical protein
VPIYCIDTSSLIRAWHEAYSIDVVPSFWVALEKSMQAGQVIFPDEVLREASKRDPDLHKWLRDQSQAIVGIDEVQERLAEVMGRFPFIANNRKGAFSADGVVIALAAHRDAVVVSEESLTDSEKRPRIPDVCRKLDLPCIKLLEFMRRSGWKF